MKIVSAEIVSKHWGQFCLCKCLVDTGLGFHVRGDNNNGILLLFPCYLLNPKLNSSDHELLVYPEIKTVWVFVDSSVTGK